VVQDINLSNAAQLRQMSLARLDDWQEATGIVMLISWQGKHHS